MTLVSEPSREVVTMTRRTMLLGVFLCLAGASACWAEDPNVTRKDLAEAAERGRKALLGRAYVPPTITLHAYDNAWRLWGLKEKPADADYDKLFRERYGLHAAPYPNGRYPMGLREANLAFPFGIGKALTQDCLVCHGGSIAGQSYVGLGNASLDYQALHEELAADGRRTKSPFRFSNVRGTSEA